MMETKATLDVVVQPRQVIGAKVTVELSLEQAVALRMLLRNTGSSPRYVAEVSDVLSAVGIHYEPGEGLRSIKGAPYFSDDAGFIIEGVVARLTAAL